MKTKKYKKLGIEVTETLHYGKSYEEARKLKPKGWRLLKPSEAMAIWEKENFKDWFFVEQMDKKLKKKFIARFVADSGWADLVGSWDPDVGGPALGIKFCRSINHKQGGKNEQKIQDRDV